MNPDDSRVIGDFRIRHLPNAFPAFECWRVYNVAGELVATATERAGAEAIARKFDADSASYRAHMNAVRAAHAQGDAP